MERGIFRISTTATMAATAMRKRKRKKKKKGKMASGGGCVLGAWARCTSELLPAVPFARNAESQGKKESGWCQSPYAIGTQGTQYLLQPRYSSYMPLVRGWHTQHRPKSLP